MRIAASAAITVPLGTCPVPSALRSIEKTTAIFTKLVGYVTANQIGVVVEGFGSVEEQRRTSPLPQLLGFGVSEVFMAR
ncbi:MAG: hypothetical protein SangKO_021310 [Sandaracinaceae bacterium]